MILPLVVIGLVLTCCVDCSLFIPRLILVYVRLRCWFSSGYVLTLVGCACRVYRCPSLFYAAQPCVATFLHYHYAFFTFPHTTTHCSFITCAFPQFCTHLRLTCWLFPALFTFVGLLRSVCWFNLRLYSCWLRFGLRSFTFRYFVIYLVHNTRFARLQRGVRYVLVITFDSPCRVCWYVCTFDCIYCQFPVISLLFFTLYLRWFIVAFALRFVRYRARPRVLYLLTTHSSFYRCCCFQLVLLRSRYSFRFQYYSRLLLIYYHAL